MPSWKKLIISGSDAALSSLVLTTGSLALNVTGGRTRLSSSVDITGSVDIRDGFLYVQNSLDTDARVAYDSTGYQSINYQSRMLKDGAGGSSVSYGGPLTLYKHALMYDVNVDQEGDIITIANSAHVTLEKPTSLLIDLTQYEPFSGTSTQLYNTYYQYTYTMAYPIGAPTSLTWQRIGTIEVFNYNHSLSFSQSIKIEQGTAPASIAFDTGGTVDPTKLYFTADDDEIQIILKYKALIM